MNDSSKGLSASDIAWAECGGVIVDDETGQLCKLVKVLDGINNGVIVVCPAQIETPDDLVFELPKVSAFAVPVIHARMATKKQCDEGRVKYIKSPMLCEKINVKQLNFKQNNPNYFSAITSYGKYSIYKIPGSCVNEAGDIMVMYQVEYRDSRGRIATGTFDEVVVAANKVHQIKIESEVSIGGCGGK